MKYLCLIPCVLALSACGTPPEVRELSADVGAAVLKMNEGAQGVANATRKHAESRLSTLDAYSRSTIRSRIDLEGQIAAAREGGDPIVRTYDGVRKFTTEQDAKARKLEAGRQKMQDDQTKAQAALTVDASEYKKVTDDLATLAKEKDRWTRISGTSEWLKDVVDRVRQAEAQAEAAAAGKAAGK